jgi:hypothetical protein
MSSPHPTSQSLGLGDSSAECHERLADQLHTLSQVVETITYRLLEMEERLTEQESQLQALDQQAGASVQLSDGAAQRFDDTEDRLVRLESLLNGLERAPSAGTSRHLQSVRGKDLADSDLEPGLQTTIDGPFLEEPEQPFMDDVQIQDTQIDLDELDELTA